MPPYPTYLIFGNVLNSSGGIISGASLKVKTSIGNKTFTSSSNGIYLFDLAEVGYISGETVIIDVTDPFNNEFTQDSFVVENSFRESNITTAVRTLAIGVTGYSNPSIIHSIGKEPITKDNALPTKDVSNPLTEYGLAGGDDQNRIFGYIKTNGEWYIQKFETSTSRYLYVRGNINFATNWTNRASLTYGTYDVVF